MLENLNTFLCSLQLQQYYDAFIKAGVTDQDGHQLVRFSNNELDELLCAIKMLPFHAIKFKRAIRMLQSPQEKPIDTNNDHIMLASTQEFVRANAMIYGKKKNRALTSYEEAINHASFELALKNPLMISKKGQLFDLAKKKLLEDGYQYKRGVSRSKLSSTTPTKSIQKDKKDRTNQSLLQKRQENAQRMSEKRVEKMNALAIQIDEAIQQRQQAEKKLLECQDDILASLECKAESIRCEQTKIKLTREISKLKAKERKHQWYMKRKSSSSLSSLSGISNNDEDETFLSSSQFSNNEFSIYQSASSCSSFGTQEDQQDANENSL